MNLSLNSYTYKIKIKAILSTSQDFEVQLRTIVSTQLCIRFCNYLSLLESTLYEGKDFCFIWFSLSITQNCAWCIEGKQYNFCDCLNNAIPKKKKVFLMVYPRSQYFVFFKKFSLVSCNMKYLLIDCLCETNLFVHKKKENFTNNT